MFTRAPLSQVKPARPSCPCQGQTQAIKSVKVAMAWRHRNQQHSSIIQKWVCVGTNRTRKQGLWSSHSCYSGCGGEYFRQSVYPSFQKLVLFEICNDDRWPFPPYLILKISAHDLNSREFLVSSRCNLRELGGALCTSLIRHY